MALTCVLPNQRHQIFPEKNSLYVTTHSSDTKDFQKKNSPYVNNNNKTATRIQLNFSLSILKGPASSLCLSQSSWDRRLLRKKTQHHNCVILSSQREHGAFALHQVVTRCKNNLNHWA